MNTAINLDTLQLAKGAHDRTAISTDIPTL